MTVIDHVTVCKTKRTKGSSQNTQNWFDREVVQKLREKDKLLK